MKKNHKKLSCNIPLLTDISDSLREKIDISLFKLSVPANNTVMKNGTECENFAILTSGAVDVLIQTKTGREVGLYTLKVNDFCVLNTICLLCKSNFPAKAITKTHSEFLMLEESIFQQILHESTIFRQFIFNGLQQQLGMLLSRFEDAYAPPINEKLAAFLVKKSAFGSKPVTMTQQELANEIGTVREVISRHMLFFKDNGWLHYSRGIITIAKPETLSALGDV